MTDPKWGYYPTLSFHWGNAMTLREFLQKKDISIFDFAAQVGVSIFAVRKWLNGERIPRDKMKARIAQVTGNKVQAQDWINSL